MKIIHKDQVMKIEERKRMFANYVRMEMKFVIDSYLAMILLNHAMNVLLNLKNPMKMPSK